MLNFPVSLMKTLSVLFLSFLVHSLKKGHNSCTANSILIDLSFLGSKERLLF